MADLFTVEDYKRVSYPDIKPQDCPYFCVGFYVCGKRWRIFDTTWESTNNSDIQKFIANKESLGWIMFICKLPDFKTGAKNG